MALDEFSVENDGPNFVERVRRADEFVRKLESSQWNFSAVPELFARESRADVVAKELVHVFDGSRMTRVGRLIMGGIGNLFHLMGPIPSNSTFRVLKTPIFDIIDEQLGTNGMSDMPEVKKFGKPQQVEFFNYTNFYQLRDLAFWALLYGSGSFPSTFEHVARHFAKGDIVQNEMYRPARIANISEPRFMVSACMAVSFGSTAVEWMDKPLYGGFANDTVHLEYLLTPTPSKVSHPYLPLTGEGSVELCHQRYYLRQFSGTTPKDAVRGPNIPPEQPEDPTIPIPKMG